MNGIWAGIWDLHQNARVSGIDYPLPSLDPHSYTAAHRHVGFSLNHPSYQQIRKISNWVNKTINRCQRRDGRDVRIIWQCFSGSHGKKVPMSNYKHIWNNRKSRKTWAREILRVLNKALILQTANSGLIWGTTYVFTKPSQEWNLSTETEISHEHYQAWSKI